jgi:glycosyltransferase involved in cell wall biosynthesis
MKQVVLSAINIHTSGPLTIVRDALAAICRTEAFRRRAYEVTLFCHSAASYADLAFPGVTIVEKPRSRRSWALRLAYEYVWFYAWSRKRNIDTWVSLHDITPNVKAAHRFVYCHNPAPFYNGPSVWRWEPSFELFRRFYGIFYSINLQRNDGVVVQQEWMRQIFVKRFGSQPAQTIVARPVAPSPPPAGSGASRRRGSETLLVYPAFPRAFKNFGVLLRAMRRLQSVSLRLVLTWTGDENWLAQNLRRRFSDLPNVDFAGFLPRPELFRLYEDVDAMVFPSLLESWGLPLSEFREFGKPIFAADRSYAHEALSGYDRAAFFEPEDDRRLAELLTGFALAGEFQATRHETRYEPPFARDWDELLVLMGLA